MSKVLHDLRSLLNPGLSSTSGKVVSISGDTATVSTIKGMLKCSINIISTLGEGDEVHVENNVIVGKLRPESSLKRYYV